jgi:bacterioferritin-associated ferredoxin
VDRCICRSRLFADLLPEARIRGWDLAALMAATGCGAQCGLCRPYLRRMLETGETVFHELLPSEPA